MLDLNFLVQVLLCSIAFLLLTWYVYYQHCFLYWKRKGIPSRPPKFPAGNITDSILGRLSLFTAVENIFREFKNKGCRHVGVYFLNGPVYVPIDLEIIKSILITDFEHFTDRGTYVNEEKFNLSVHLFSLRGVEWRNLRKKMTLIFTSGKIKSFYEVFITYAEKMVEVLEKPAKENAEVNGKTISVNFAADIISAAGFGFDAKTQENPDNELSKTLLKIFAPNWWHFLQMVIVDGLQNPGNLLKPMLCDKSVEVFFRDLVTKTLKMREMNKSVRKDFITVLMEIRDEVGLSFNKLMAQCFVFYVAAFETGAQTISYGIHELAHNQDVQDRLREEIFSNLGKDIKQFSYEKLVTMPYLDQVFKEILRLYPVMGTLHRMCVKPYKIPGTDIVLEKGTPVLISTLGLQRDPEYFPEPLKFDPDRFAESKNQTPFTFLPFGEGPRTCIGMRFGTLEAKMAIAALVSQFRFLPSEKQPRVIEFDRLSSAPIMSLSHGVTVRISKL